jgi:hypothetical protein
MNVAFHELAALAITHETAARLGPPGERAGSTAPRAFAWAVAFGLALASHGILDGLVHYYPLGSWPDAALSLGMAAAWMALAPRWLWGPFLLVAAGAILPDAVDHVPRLLDRHLGLHLPQHAPLFPWHWRSDSGSYPGRTGPLWRESLTNHAIVIAFCAVSLYRTRGLLRRAAHGGARLVDR